MSVCQKMGLDTVQENGAEYEHENLQLENKWSNRHYEHPVLSDSVEETALGITNMIIK